MPSVFLSPSTQEYNPTYGGGTEEYYMNLIADRMEEFLEASGIDFARNTPDMTASESAQLSNQGNYDLHLALHSNASPENIQGSRKGADFYYMTGSVPGREATEIFAENYRKIYPDPSNVEVMDNSTFAELRATKAPAVLAELAYHDNAEDMNWLRGNLKNIARNLSMSVAQFLGVPFVEPTTRVTGTVVTQGGRLNIRDEPSMRGNIIGQIPNGESITIIGREGDWYEVTYNGITGYSLADYIELN